jgi:transcription elongation factor Elf1
MKKVKAYERTKTYKTVDYFRLREKLYCPHCGHQNVWQEMNDEKDSETQFFYCLNTECLLAGMHWDSGNAHHPRIDILSLALQPEEEETQ